MSNQFKFLIVFILTLAFWFFTNCLSIIAYSKTIYETPCDAAIVLGAASYGGKLSPVFRERMNHAISLYNQNKVKYLIITGGYGESETISDSQAAKIYAIEKGVHQEMILIEEQSKNTYENLFYANELMVNQEMRIALIVSDPYHMKRAMLMCVQIDLNGLPSPTPSSMYQSKKVKFKFLINQAYNLCIYQLFGRFRKGVNTA